MDNRMFLLSGVHGVGKGYFVQKNLKDDERFTVLEASQLISMYKKADDAGYKKVKDISDNQQILLSALQSKRKIIKNDIILDGHICMLNSDGSTQSIPEDFIQVAQIHGIILLQDEVERIIERQKSRDGLNLSVDIIREIQEEEKRICQSIFSKYKIPYMIIDNTCEYQQFCEIIKGM